MNAATAPLKPIGQIMVYDPACQPRKLLELGRYQPAGKARSVVLDRNYHGPIPSQNTFAALADWMDNNDIRILSCEMTTSKLYRVIVGM